MGRTRTATAVVLAAALLAAALAWPGGGIATAGSMGMDVKTGDANQDGFVNSLDALQILFYDAGLLEPPPYSDTVHTTSDVNCDGVLNAVDALMILQYEAGLIDIRP